MNPRILAFGVVLLAASFAQAQFAPRIDISKAPAPLFDDPIFHGATDPFVIWNPVKNQWFMYYTQRRASMPNPEGVSWVHGSKIAYATSSDGVNWTYGGTCMGDKDLSEPLKAAGGLGVEPGITWWAPGLLWEGNQMHMWVTRVDGIYSRWTGKREIMHFVSPDGVNFTYKSTAKLSSERVIDATVYQVGDTWYMVYKDEAAGSRITRSESKDLESWTNATQVTPTGSMEAPFPFFWKGNWWMMVDALGNRGLRTFKSANGIDGWEVNNVVLADRDGKRPKDDNVGHHPGIVVQGTGENEQCILYYFTHQGSRTVMQVVELELGADGKVKVDRNKYAATTSTNRPAGN